MDTRRSSGTFSPSSQVTANAPRSTSCAFSGSYTHGLPDGRSVWRQFSELTTAAAVLAAAEDCFAARSAA